jgi:excisionase family DNA binding protein
MPKLLTINELCETLKVDRSTIYRWRAQGLLPEPTKRWGSPRYDWEEVQAALKAKKSLKLSHFVAFG